MAGCPFNLFFNGRHAAINNTKGLRRRNLDHLRHLVLRTSNVGADALRYYYKPQSWNR